MRVPIANSGEAAHVAEINSGLASLQAVVDGLI